MAGAGIKVTPTHWESYVSVQDSGTINITGRLLATVGVIFITGIMLSSCGGSGGGVYGGGGSIAYYSIAGTVASGGASLAGVTMTLGGASAATVSTDANGNFSFSTLANGSYTVTPA